MKHAVRAVVTNGNKLLAMKRNKFGKEYYTLVGGGIKLGEGLETALRRELKEETGLEAGRVQLIYVEDAGEPYGMQYVFWCEYIGGEPELQVNSPEFEIGQAGQNVYEPIWLPVTELPKVNFVSGSIKNALLDALHHGFPSEPLQLDWRA